MQVSSRFLRAALAVLVLLPALLLPDTASPAEVTLQWYHSPSAAVIGYKLYFGTASREYTDSVDVGYVTEHTFSTLADGAVYFFAATAYDPYGNESEYSNEVVRDLKFGLAPGIYSLSVPQGVEGTLVAITGVNLGSRKGSVYVGTRKARVMYWSGAGISW